MELYGSCLPSIQTCSGGLQAFSSQALIPHSIKSGHRPTSSLCLTQQSTCNLESLPALCQLLRGQTIPDPPCNERANLALKVSYYSTDPSHCSQDICIASVSFCKISTSHLMAASCAPVLAAWELVTVLSNHSPENSRNYRQN